MDDGWSTGGVQMDERWRTGQMDGQRMDGWMDGWVAKTRRPFSGRPRSRLASPTGKRSLGEAAERWPPLNLRLNPGSAP